MAIIKLQGDSEKKQGIYYEFDDTSTPLGVSWKTYQCLYP